MKWLFYCFVLFFPGESLATPGYDVLGLAMQDVGMVANAIEANTAIGVLDGTFGDAEAPLEKVLKTGKVSSFRAHLLNGTCWRNHNCEGNEPKVTDIKAITKRAKKFEATHQKYPNVKCYVSPVLEHDVKDQTLVRRWYDALRLGAPSCTPVCSAFTGWCPPGVLKEVHGNTITGDISSNDGVSLYDAETPGYFTHGSNISFGWIHRFNLRVSGEHSWTPPSKRTTKATRDDFAQINALMKPVASIPPKPSACKNLLEIKSPELLKSNSEDYGRGAPRDNKPVFITKKKYPQLNILSASGKKVGCLSYYGSFPPNLTRSYVGTCSNKSNVEMLHDAGSEWVFYRTGNGDCYLANAVRRLGYYR